MRYTNLTKEQKLKVKEKFKKIFSKKPSKETSDMGRYPKSREDAWN